MMKCNLIVLIFLVITGCSKPKPKVVTKTIYKIKTRVVLRDVPVMVPIISCNFKGVGYTPTIKLIECVIKQKKVLDTLRSSYLESLKKIKKS